MKNEGASLKKEAVQKVKILPLRLKSTT